ncbi:MAG: DUF1517 domain-containing protein [Sandaracinaceae bacterium]
MGRPLLAADGRHLVSRRRRRWAGWPSRTPAASRTPIWLQRISIGFDWTVREALQSRLDELSRTLRFDSDADRAEATHAVLALLREHMGGARYGLVRVWPLDDGSGPARLEAHATDLRARFTDETRGTRVNADAPEMRARPEEGPGMLVVSLLFASYEALTEVEIRDRPSARIAVSVEPGSRVPGLDVIWSPAEADDRMSSHELERFYPELRRMDDAGDVGSLACPHCGAPRPAELAFCPHCGSPTRA